MNVGMILLKTRLEMIIFLKIIFIINVIIDVLVVLLIVTIVHLVMMNYIIIK